MEKIREKTKKVSLKKVAWKSGTMHLMDVVSDEGIIIGKGYVISFPDGYMSAPELFDYSGNKLPEGWYGLKIYEYKLCVVARNVQ